MITKLGLIIGIVPILILYAVKCFENKYWITTPLSFIITIVAVFGVMLPLFMLFMKIGWLPENF